MMKNVTERNLKTLMFLIQQPAAVIVIRGATTPMAMTRQSVVQLRVAVPMEPRIRLRTVASMPVRLQNMYAPVELQL